MCFQIITSVGGYSALFMSIQAHINPGDEVTVDMDVYLFIYFQYSTQMLWGIIILKNKAYH